MRYNRSSALFAQAKKVIPGGVNSPVRAFKAVGGTPIFIKEAKGAYLFDEDGHSYIDFISSWGPLILGHGYKPVVEAVQKQADKGTSYGIPTALETNIAELATSMAPNIDKIRFVNSGTEACMSAVRLARGYTSREKSSNFQVVIMVILMFSHSGRVVLDFWKSNSPGVTQGTAKDTLLANYNDIDNVTQLFEANEGEIAAVIIEPVAGNMGCIPPEPGFLEGLRYLCDQNDTLLIFDEVMTGFRLAAGGAQQLLGVDADIVTFGKVIGGGLPVGAFAAREEIMDFLAPEGPVYQAGTLSGNPLAMAAGFAMLTALDSQPEVFDSLADKTAYLHEGMKNILSKSRIDYQINRLGSMISLHFTDTAVKDFTSAAKGNNKRFTKYFHGMLKRGVYLPPSAFESYFLNDAISYKDIDATLQAFSETLKEL